MKRTVIIENPARLSLRKGQVLVTTDDGEHVIPTEDIGILLVDHPGCTVGTAVVNALMYSQAALVLCSDNHMPSSLTLPLEGHVTQQETMAMQAAFPADGKGRLWRMILTAKYAGQRAALAACGASTEAMDALVEGTDGDESLEGPVAKVYFRSLFGGNFRRNRAAGGTNALLNYGYTVLRAAVARALVCSGLHPGFGVGHHGRYDAFVLADDVMEPYRPLVDLEVKKLSAKGLEAGDREAREALVAVLHGTCLTGGCEWTVADAISMTASSVAGFFRGEREEVIFPLPK